MRIRTHIILFVLIGENNVVRRLIHQRINATVDQELIVLLPLVHYHTHHLQTTSLLGTLAFAYRMKAQIMKSKAATSSGTRRVLLAQKEQFV
jgi:hypothetical protein